MKVQHTPTTRGAGGTMATVAVIAFLIYCTVTMFSSRAEALTNSHYCGRGIDTSVVNVTAWRWQYNDHAPAHTAAGDVGVWTNAHGKIVGYSAHEDTNIRTSARCASIDL